MFRCHGPSLPVVFLLSCVVFVGCGDDDSPADLGVSDLGISDLGVDLGAGDLGVADLGPVDAGTPDLAGCPDLDGDGHASPLCGGDDCDDADAARFPGNAELCDSAGHDEDCVDLTFGDLDVDGDGAVSSACCGLRSGALECAADCDDSRADVGFRSAQEICDGIDNDCDGAVDEASVAIPWYRDLDGDGFGDASAPTTLSCAPPSGYAVIPFDCDDRSSAVSPAVTETCNGHDDDCDGAIDDGACTPLPDGGVADGGADAGSGPDLGADPCDRCIWRCVAEQCDDAIRIATHGFGGCAARELGGLVCWGNSGDGQIGIGPGDSSPSPVPIALTNVVQVAGGYLHVCALTADGTLYCWGDNSRGQLGVGDLLDRLVPTPVSIAENVIEVTAGGHHTCARISSGELRCWGANDSGQLGIGSAETERVWPTVVLSPDTVFALRGVVSVRAGGEHTCASTGAELYCWGENLSGQLGVGDTVDRSRPVLALLPRTPVSLATGSDHTCAIDRLGYLYCWGNGSRGELGSGTAINSDEPLRVMRAFPADFVEVVAGAYHTCVRLRDGTVWCAGGNNDAQLGDGSMCPILPGDECGLDWVPANVENAVSLAAMELGACAFLVSGEITCWGSNSYGALGMGDYGVYTVPQLVTTP